MNLLPVKKVPVFAAAWQRTAPTAQQLELFQAAPENL